MIGSPRTVAGFLTLLVACSGGAKRTIPVDEPWDGGDWGVADAGPPPASAVDEAYRRVKKTLLEIEVVSADGRTAQAKPRCELALTVAAEDIEASDRADAKASLAKLQKQCDERVFPAALREDLQAVQRFAKAGDIQGVHFICEKDRVIHERTSGRKDAAAFAEACQAAWTAPLPGGATPR